MSKRNSSNEANYDIYQKVSDEIDNRWPSWKKEACNQNFSYIGKDKERI